MYPILREDVSFRIQKRKNSNEVRYFVKNIDGQEFEINQALYDALRKADGTKPMYVPDGEEEIISELKKSKIIYTSRFVHLAGPLFGFILFPVGNNVRKFKWLFKLLNSALPLTAVFCFAVGIVSMLYKTYYSGIQIGEIIYWFQILLMFISTMFHEIGHMNAGIAYGYKICSVGVLMFILFPVGGYVSLNSRIKYKKSFTKKEQVQFNLAGVESNLLVAGILMLLSFTADGNLSYNMIMAANINILVAVLNFLPAFGLDGESALSALLEVESISVIALKTLFSKSGLKRLFKYGIAGCFGFLFFCFLLIVQVIVVLTVIADFIGMIWILIDLFH